MKFFAQILIACTIVEALQSLRPGAQWTIRGGVVEWDDIVQVQPSTSEVNTAIAQCQTNQTQQQGYAVELSTCETALSNLYPNLVAPTAVQSQKAVMLQARILILRYLLGQ